MIELRLTWEHTRDRRISTRVGPAEAIDRLQSHVHEVWRLVKIESREVTEWSEIDCEEMEAA